MSTLSDNEARDLFTDGDVDHTEEEAQARWDAWIAEHDASVGAQAWETGLNTGIGYKTAMDVLGGSAPEPPNPYAAEEVE
ncbi:hypothetical protein ACTXJK_15005 [Brachybacterium tyrofermentans]|uniref:hypothetical protein n=1 Tax=Brachybacterium tyrofermentans TaxID=47848 RepID=UPI003FCF8DED